MSGADSRSCKASAGQGFITPGLTLLLAVTAGVTVANNYYNQPLLPKMAETFGAGASAVSWVAVATQLGYASGLALVVPMGDCVNRKALLVATSLGAVAALLLLAASGGLPMAVGTSFLLGLVCVTPQVAVPYGAGLAEPARRGRTVGVIMGGLLVGVLGARIFSGFLGEFLGWREVFAAGAGLTLLLGGLLLRLPSAPVESPVAYREALGSLLPLLRREPLLQRHCLLGALAFGAFSVFWTTMAFYLESRPERYGGVAVGFFGCIAIAGVASAPIAGRLSDRLGPRAVNGAALSAMALAFGMMALSGFSLAWMALGTFLMDAGTQGNHISNQTRIYTLPGELRSRVTSVYMISYFLGGTLGSLIGARAWRDFGWNGVCGAGALLSVLGLAVLALYPVPPASQHRP